MNRGPFTLLRSPGVRARCVKQSGPRSVVGGEVQLPKGAALTVGEIARSSRRGQGGKSGLFL